MSMMSDLHVDVAYGAPEMNKEYLDNIINGNALDEVLPTDEMGAVQDGIVDEYAGMSDPDSWEQNELAANA